MKNSTIARKKLSKAQKESKNLKKRMLNISSLQAKMEGDVDKLNTQNSKLFWNSKLIRVDIEILVDQLRKIKQRHNKIIDQLLIHILKKSRNPYGFYHPVSKINSNLEKLRNKEASVIDSILSLNKKLIGIDSDLRDSKQQINEIREDDEVLKDKKSEYRMDYLNNANKVKGLTKKLKLAINRENIEEYYKELQQQELNNSVVIEEVPKNGLSCPQNGVVGQKKQKSSQKQGLSRSEVKVERSKKIGKQKSATVLIDLL